MSAYFVASDGNDKYETKLNNTILDNTKLYSTIYWTMLCYADTNTQLYYCILHYNIRCCTVQHSTMLLCSGLHYTILYFAILYYIYICICKNTYTRNYTILYYSILRYTTLYDIVLYYTILYHALPS